MSEVNIVKEAFKAFSEAVPNDFELVRAVNNMRCFVEQDLLFGRYDQVIMELQLLVAALEESGVVNASVAIAIDTINMTITQIAKEAFSEIDGGIWRARPADA